MRKLSLQQTANILKVVVVIAWLLLMNSIVGCTTDDKDMQIKNYATITNTGGSPEVFVTSNCVTTRYATPCLNIEVKKGDVITALGFSYSTDNSNNYGGTNVNVTANITIQIDNKIVKTGVGHCSYQFN